MVAQRALFTITILAYLSQSIVTFAQKIPLTVGAAAMMDLASDRLYQEFGDALTYPDSPFDVRLMVRGEGGSDEQNFNSVRRGRMQMGGVSYGAVSTVIPELAVLNAPFLFDSYGEMDFVLAAGLEDTVNSMIGEVGLVGLGQNAASWHIVYSKANPIVRPKQARGVRMRSRIDTSSILFLQALGADVIHLSATDVIPSLQTGLIDAGETNSFVYLLNGIYSEAPHLTLTNHVPSITAFIANERWWKNMTKAQRTMVVDALAPRNTWNAPMRADEKRLLCQYMERGVIIHRLSDESRAQWKAVTWPSHRTLIDEIGGRAQELYDVVMEAKARYKPDLIEDVNGASASLDKMPGCQQWSL